MHLTRVAASVSFGLLALVAGATATAQDKATVGARFQPTTQAWATAYNAGDADAIVAMYAKDAVVMPPDAPSVSGAEALRSYLARDMAGAKQAGITLAIDDGSSGTSGNLGWHAGTFAVSDAAGKTVGTGKYMEVWERRDGKWVMIRDIWNNDAAATPATPATPAPAPTPEPDKD